MHSAFYHCFYYLRMQGKLLKKLIEREFNFMEDSVNTSLSLAEIIFRTCQE